MDKLVLLLLLVFSTHGSSQITYYKKDKIETISREYPSGFIYVEFERDKNTVVIKSALETTHSTNWSRYDVAYDRKTATENQEKGEYSYTCKGTYVAFQLTIYKSEELGFYKVKIEHTAGISEIFSGQNVYVLMW